jgi:hypothetical protein
VVTWFARLFPRVGQHEDIPVDRTKKRPSGMPARARTELIAAYVSFQGRVGLRTGSESFMQVRTARLGRGRLGPLASESRWIVVALFAALAVATRAEEEQVVPSSSASKTVKAKLNPTAATPEPSTPARIASADQAGRGGRSVKTAVLAVADPAATAAQPEAPIERAIRTIADSRLRYEQVEDYICTFYKRERIAGRLTAQHIMSMKVRTKPHSVYFKFQQPAQGREAIFIAGRHGSKVLAHDVGLNKLLAGTLALEPNSARAMEDCRHPITEAGIGHLLDTLATRWAVELDPEETKVSFRDDMLIGPRRVTMIESKHPIRRPEFMHHMVRVYIDQELGLPIRFEAFDWAKHAGAEPLLTEEYSYSHLKLNVGLQDIDFDVSNSAYAFGRF